MFNKSIRGTGRPRPAASGGDEKRGLNKLLLQKKQHHARFRPAKSASGTDAANFVLRYYSRFFARLASGADAARNAFPSYKQLEFAALHFKCRRSAFLQ